MFKFDPFALDRSLARYAGQYSRFRGLLARGGGRDHAFEFRPPELDEELLETLRNAGDRDPLAGPLLRWAEFLVLEHALTEPELRVAEALHSVIHPLDRPERGTFSIWELRRRAVIDDARREHWLDALESRTQSLQARRFELFERRAERAEALRITRPNPLTVAPDALDRCLALSADAYAELGVGSLGAALSLGLGRDVPGNFPARLGLRSLAELLREGDWFRGLEPELTHVPEMWGAASVLRGLYRLGSALHEAGAGKRQPFVVAHDPFGFRRALFGGLFSLLPLNAAFAQKRLDVGRARFSDYRRALVRVVLLALRVDCVRSQLSLASAQGPKSYRTAFREAVPAALGFEVSPALLGVLWVSDRAPTRICGLLAALAKNDRLIEAHDEDWFRNPRAVSELRAEFESAPALEPEKAEIARGLELLPGVVN
ncbi:MAG TPA: hypothetical protein VG937_11325 [Polyangiaceae bacterium]|nr:hypothetical protein [Polyangiaceae bacterium]